MQWRQSFQSSLNNVIPLFWDVMLHNWASGSQHIKGIYCLHSPGSSGPWRMKEVDTDATYINLGQKDSEWQ